MEEHEPMKSTGAGGMILRYAQEEETIGWTLKNEEHLGRNGKGQLDSELQERESPQIPLLCRNPMGAGIETVYHRC